MISKSATSRKRPAGKLTRQWSEPPPKRSRARELLREALMLPEVRGGVVVLKRWVDGPPEAQAAFEAQLREAQAARPGTVIVIIRSFSDDERDYAPRPRSLSPEPVPEMPPEAPQSPLGASQAPEPTPSPPKAVCAAGPSSALPSAMAAAMQLAGMSVREQGHREAERQRAAVAQAEHDRQVELLRLELAIARVRAGGPDDDDPGPGGDA